MEKERAIQCVPVEMLARLKALAERLWSDNNPSSVHINAILEEFAPDVKALGYVVSEYEADCASRVLARHEEHTRAEARLQEEIQALKNTVAALENENASALENTAELRAAVRAGDARLDELKSKSLAAERELKSKLAEMEREAKARTMEVEREVKSKTVEAERELRSKALDTEEELKSKAMEVERELNHKYVARTQELYDQLNKKELELLAKWEEKNKELEARARAVEEDCAGRAARLEAREKELEEEARARKAEFIKVFDHVRTELAARGKALAEHERSLAYWEKTHVRREGEEQ